MKLIRHNYDILVYWINERESIRLQKEHDAIQPWSSDPLMTKWRWCNVNRCHDRETRWIFKNIIEGNEESDTLWFNLCIGRFINWSPTLAKLGYIHKWDGGYFVRTLEDRAASGEKVFTGAYMIRGGTGEDAKVSKSQYLVNRLFDPLWKARDNRPADYMSSKLHLCADWDKFLGSFFGMGDFMRNQIITDMKYTKYILPECHTKDWRTFCLTGPGTRRGLNRLTGQELTKTWPTEDANLALRTIRELIQEDTCCPEHFDDLNNLANCFCEFDKYMRLKNGEGEPRSTYRRSPDPLP